MPPGLRSPPACPRCGLRPDALPAALACWPDSWRRTRTGHAPETPPAVGQTKGWRHSSPRPPPQRALRLASSSSTCGQLSVRFMAIQFRLHRIALALLERGVDPADRFLTPLLEPELAPTARQKLHRSSRKSRGTIAATTSIASQRACRQSLAWGKRGRQARFTTGPSTATFFSKLSVMFRSSLDTSIKPILSPRKSGRLRG